MADSPETRLNKQQLYRRPLREGMTLVELLLVVAIMVIVAAMAAPSIHRTLARLTLLKGADRVRVAMGQARVRAIRDGEEFAVYYLPDGAWFNVAPFAKIQEQSGIASRRQQNIENGTQTHFEDDMLPKGVRFVAAETYVDSRAATVMGEAGGSGSVKFILFYPDGTSQDAKVTLQNEKQALIKIQLRGLTGIAKTIPVTESQ